jgi:hypothetical protein
VWLPYVLVMRVSRCPRRAAEWGPQVYTARTNRTMKLSARAT